MTEVLIFSSKFYLTLYFCIPAINFYSCVLQITEEDAIRQHQTYKTVW